METSLAPDLMSDDEWAFHERFILADGTHRDALVGHAAQFSPCGQCGHQPAIDVGGVSAGMTTDLLEPDGSNGPGQTVQLAQPVGEAQVAHAPTIEAAGAEGSGPAGDQAILAMQGPACRCAEVERKDGALAMRRQNGRFLGCAKIGVGESRISHEWSPLLVGCSGGRRRRLMLGGTGRRRRIDLGPQLRPEKNAQGWVVDLPACGGSPPTPLGVLFPCSAFWRKPLKLMVDFQNTDE